MADSESAPLLSMPNGDRSSNKTSRRTSEDVGASESTPLLGSSSAATPRYDGELDDARNADISSVAPPTSDAASAKSVKQSTWRSPSIIAMIVLALLASAVIVLAFFVPAAVEEYAKQALVIEPTNLALESITADGIRARIQANIRLDAQRVRNEHVRRVGRATTWLVGQLATEETKVNVYLPEYDNLLLGKAAVPPLTVNLEDGKNNALDFVADLVPGDAEVVRTIANDFLGGKLDVLRLRGKADIQLKAAGFIPLGTHSISESMSFEANKLPQLPAYNITKVNFVEEPVPGEDEKVMVAEVSITAFNEHPISVDIPELGFEALVPGCSPYDAPVLVASVMTSPVAVRPLSDVVVTAHGRIRELPEPLTRACPGTKFSPLDNFFKKYLGGEAPTVLVRGQKQPVADTPDWLSEILSSLTVPVPFPGRTPDDLIRSFSLTDVHFTLPDPNAEPGDPDSNPKVSGTILVTAGLPAEMNFELNVTSVKANATVFYHSKKLGELNLRDEWRAANSTQYPAKENHEATLDIQSRIQDAPLEVTDGDVLTSVISALLFGTENVVLGITALVDVRIQTIIGLITVKDIPAKGNIPLKRLSPWLKLTYPDDLAIPGDSFGSIAPKASNIQVIDTTPESVSLSASVNITNPTPYSAHIPFISIHIYSNDTLLGEATAKNLDLTTGNNTGLAVTALWHPSLSGNKGVIQGRNMISQYLSGYNTSITLKSHRGSIPAQPLIGEALSKLNITVSAPRLSLPGDSGEDEETHFIRDATFHVFSSTATFTLVSPLEHNTIYIERVNATALYNHTETVGRIAYDLPFAAPPGKTQTPRLPVEWSLDSVGYEKLKEALGGKMKLDAKAVVGVRLGQWTETLWYYGKGIGASVRP